MESKCCWTKGVVTPAECPYISPDEADLLAAFERRFITKCIDCPRFGEDLDALTAAGNPVVPLLRILAAEVLSQKTKLDTMVDFLDSRNLEIQFLNEIGGVLQTSLELDEVLSVVLTAITAGKGFGMNRAFLLLADKDRRYLKGYMGVGPKDYQEAWEIWDEIGKDDLTLRDMAKHFHETKFSEEKDKFHSVLERLTVPLGDTEHIFNRCLQGRRPILVQDAFQNPRIDREIVGALGVDTFLIIPLVTRNRRVGVILADNFITRKAITPQDMQSMETLSFPIAFAIERASLYERLHEDLHQLTLANAKLQEQQELIIRMEKLALLGKITSSIAHSIRNPLMIIGGFARSLLKNIEENDAKKESLETIVREAKHLENALSETLSYANSIFPAMDQWDINQLVGNVLREVRKNLDIENITLNLDLAPELPMVYLDYRQLAYSIKKILRNSLDSMAVPGELYVATRLEEDAVLVEIRNFVFRTEEHSPGVAQQPMLAARDDSEDMDLSFCRVILDNYCKSFTVEEYGSNGRRYALRLALKKEETDHE